MARENYDGRDAYLIYDEETSYGAGGDPAVAKNFGRVQSVTLDMNQNLIRSQGIGEGPNAVDVSLGVFDVSGSLSSKPVDFTFLTFGVGTKTGGGASAGDPFILTENDIIGYSANQIPSINIELGEKAISNHQVKQITGSVFESWTLSGEIGQELLCDVRFQGQTVTRSTTIETYTAPTTRTFKFNDGGLNWATESLNITRFSITCVLNPVFPREVANRFRKQPTLGVRRYDWTLTMNMNYDDTASTLSTTEFISDFFQAANAPIANGPITGDAFDFTIREGTSSGDQNLLIQLENSFVTSWSENPSVEGGQISVNVSGFSLAGKDDGAGNKEPIHWWTAA